MVHVRVHHPPTAESRHAELVRGRKFVERWKRKEPQARPELPTRCANPQCGMLLATKVYREGPGGAEYCSPACLSAVRAAGLH